MHTTVKYNLYIKRTEMRYTCEEHEDIQFGWEIFSVNSFGEHVITDKGSNLKLTCSLLNQGVLGNGRP